MKFSSTSNASMQQVPRFPIQKSTALWNSLFHQFSADYHPNIEAVVQASENMQQTYRRACTLKCDFNKI